MQISWTKLPFPARTQEEFRRGLTDWLGQVFYETLPEQGFEIREEQIYTAFRMARTLADGTTLFAEAGSGTGKTFAYLLPAVCYARFRGRPVVVASASGVLQAQLVGPDGDIQTLSRILGLQIDARQAADPSGYICRVKADYAYPERGMKGWKALQSWAKRTRTGARAEVPTVSDDLWSYVAWDPSLPCDTCRHRGTCHLMMARRHYRAAGDLIITDHGLFARDLLTRAERLEAGQMPLLPAYSALVLDEGHHVPEIWQRAQGFSMSASHLQRTLDLIVSGYGNRGSAGRGLADARWERREFMAEVLVAAIRQESQAFLNAVLAAAGHEEGRRHVVREGGPAEAAAGLTRAIEALQDDLVTEEAMQEGTEREVTLRAYQARLDEILEALALFRSQEAVLWVEGEDLWVVPRNPLAPFGPRRLPAGLPVLFSSATLEPAYMARILQPPRYDSSRVDVPFNLAHQVLVFQGDPAADEMEAVS
ncbi:MAG TPA: ATP-dependent DNA helicase, partial [Symbiobacteriaceae bacterium]|nr:ATP-dependent DNA helicase [Symbiobacteriaceae bacterium]